MKCDAGLFEPFVAKSLFSRETRCLWIGGERDKGFIVLSGSLTAYGCTFSSILCWSKCDV